MIELTEQDFYSLKKYYKTAFFREVFYEANSTKLRVDYSKIKDCLKDKGLETFRKNVSNDLENQMEQFTHAINNHEQDDADVRFGNVLQQSGFTENGFLEFFENYCKNMFLIKDTEKVFKNAVSYFNKMSKISADKNNREDDINARSDILKQVAIMTRNIRTICSFAYNVFSFILTCTISNTIKNKFTAMLTNATCEGNLKWPKLIRGNVNLLRFENFVPNASRIYDDSQELLRDVDNRTPYVS